MKRVIKILSVIFLIGILVSLIFWGKDTKQAKARTFSSDELLTKAQSALKQQDCTDAIAWSRQGLQSSPDYADIKIVMGRAFLLNGQPDSAEKNIFVGLTPAASGCGCSAIPREYRTVERRYSYCTG